MNKRKDGFCRQGGSKKYDKDGNLIEINGEAVKEKSIKKPKTEIDKGEK